MEKGQSFQKEFFKIRSNNVSVRFNSRYNKNEEKHIKECLDSLMGLDYPIERYEVILVDGYSSDETMYSFAREIKN